MQPPRTALFLVLYCSAVVYVCLYPWIFSEIAHTHSWYWNALDNRRLQLDFGLNVLLFIPIGAAACAIFGSRIYGAMGAIVLGLGLSCAIEWIQRYVP